MHAFIDRSLCLANKYSKGIAALAATGAIALAKKLGVTIPGHDALVMFFVTVIVVFAPKNKVCSDSEE